MRIKQSIEVSNDQYKQLIEVQKSNGSAYAEHHVGGRRSVVLKGKVIFSTVRNANLNIGDLTSREFGSFIALFNRQLYKSFRDRPELYDLKVEFRGVSMDKNKQLWNNLEIGTSFYNIDLSSAYWQVAHRLGYISDNVFERYMARDRYKEAKRYCVSFLGRENRMFYPEGRKIECDTSVLRNVYQNIRYELYKIIGKAREVSSDYLEYHIDGISILAKDVDNVKAYFNAEGLDFKITYCRKVTELEYLYGNKKRKFKHK